MQGWLAVQSLETMMVVRICDRRFGIELLIIIRRSPNYHRCVLRHHRKNSFSLNNIITVIIAAVTFVPISFS
jgi:hypothetical protein